MPTAACPVTLICKHPRVVLAAAATVQEEAPVLAAMMLVMTVPTIAVVEAVLPRLIVPSIVQDFTSPPLVTVPTMRAMKYRAELLANTTWLVADAAAPVVLTTVVVASVVDAPSRREVRNKAP